MTPSDRLKALLERVEGLEDVSTTQLAALERIEERQEKERAERAKADERRERAINETLDALEEKVGAFGSGLGDVTAALGSFEGAMRSVTEANERTEAHAEGEGLERQSDAIKGLIDDLRKTVVEDRRSRARLDPGEDIAALREGMDDVRTLVKEVRSYRYREGQRHGTRRGRVRDWWGYSRSGAAVLFVGLVLAALGVSFVLQQVALTIAPEGTRRIQAGAALGTGDPMDFYDNGWALIRASDPDWYAVARFGTELLQDNRDIVNGCLNQSIEETLKARTQQSISRSAFILMPCTLRFMAGYSLNVSRTRPEGSEPTSPPELEPQLVPVPRTRPDR